MSVNRKTTEIVIFHYQITFSKFFLLREIIYAMASYKALGTYY